MTAPVIHICGWPGSGKATIGRALAVRVNGRLIDNHLMLDPASALFDRTDPRHAALRAALRREIWSAALTLPPDVPLIVTDALSDSAEDQALFAPTEALAKQRGAPLCAITLRISPEENRRRLTMPDRATRSKLTDPDILEHLRAKHRLLEPRGALTLDVTHLAPDTAAKQIADMLTPESHST